MYCMGDEADDILSSLGLSNDDKKSYDTVKTKLEGHFVFTAKLTHQHSMAEEQVYVVR